MTDLASLQVSVSDTGIDTTAARLSQFASEATKAAAANQALAAQARAATPAQQQQTQATTQATQAATQSATAQSAHVQALGAVAAMAPVVTAHTVGMGTATQQVAAGMLHGAAAAGSFANGATTAGRAVNLTNTQLTNLTYQLNDVVSGLAMGQSAMMILAQQGGQVYQALSMGPGGLAGGLRDLGVRLAALMTPFNVFGAALLAVGTTSLIAAMNFQSTTLAMDTMAAGVGRAAGVTGDSLNQMAMKVSEAKNMTVGAAQEIQQALMRTGTVTASNFEQGMIATEGFAKAMGMELPDAIKAVSSALADPAKGIDQLNQQLNIADGRMTSFIKSTAASDPIRAAGIIIDLLAKRTEEASTKAHTFTSIWERLQAGVSRGMNIQGAMVMDFISPGEITRIADARDKLAEANKNLQAMNGTTAQGSALARDYWERQKAGAEATINKVEELARANREAAKAGEELAIAMAKTRRADAATETVTGNRGRVAGERADAIQSGLDAGAKNITDPATGGKVDVSNIKDTTAALSALRLVQKEVAAAGGEMGAALEKNSRVFAAEVQTIRAHTVAEKAAAAEAKSLADSYLQQLTPLQRNIAAHQARTRVLEQEARREKDELRDAQAATAASVRTIAARTVSQRAAAAQENAHSAALRAGSTAAHANAMALEASNKVKREAAATARALNETMQITLEGQQKITEAQSLDGEARIRAIAAAKEEQAIRLEGTWELEDERNKRIALAQAIAVEANASNDAAAAKKKLADARGQVRLIEEEVKWINAEARALGMSEVAQNAVTMAKERAMAMIRAENEALAAEEDGNYKLAAAIREASRALDEATAKKNAATLASQQHAAALERERAAYAAAQAQRRELISQGRDPDSPFPTHQEGGTTRASDWPQAGAGGRGFEVTVGLDPGMKNALEREFGSDGYDVHVVGGITGFGSLSLGAVGQPNAKGYQYQADKQAKEAMNNSGLGNLLSMLNDTYGDLQGIANEDLTDPRIKGPPKKPGAARITQGEETPDGLSPFGRNANYFFDPSSRKTFAEQFNGFSDYVKAADAKKHQEEMKKYQLEMKAYESEVKQYDEALERKRLAQQQLLQLENIAKFIRENANRMGPEALANAIRGQLGAIGQIMAEAMAKKEGPFGGISATDKGLTINGSTGLTGSSGGPVEMGFGGPVNRSNVEMGFGGPLADRNNPNYGKFASGGSFKVGGSGGTDSNRVMLDLTRGERVDVTKGGKGKGNTIQNNTVNVSVNDNAELKKSSGTARRELSRMQRRMR